MSAVSDPTGPGEQNGSKTSDGCKSWLRLSLGSLRGNQYQPMAHSAAGIASKVNEHALALGLPPSFGGEVKETDPTQHEVWVRMVDHVKGDISNELVATLHQPRGTNPSIIPDPFDLHRQAEFLAYVDRLKREMQRRGGDTPAQPAVGLKLTASPTDSARSRSFACENSLMRVLCSRRTVVGHGHEG